MKTIITIKGVFKAILFIYLLSTVNYGQKYYSPYFPMAFGKTWYYTSNDYPDTLVSSIVDTATIKNNFYYCFAPYGPNPNWQRYWLRPEANQIFALNSQDSTEYLLFNYAANLDESWNIPPDSGRWHVPVNQCDWGKTITLTSNSETVNNPNRVFKNCILFSHLYQPCYDAGIGSTRFYRDFGIVHFAQTTEGGVIDWHLNVNKPDTISIVGEYLIIGNPCLSIPCLPTVVSAVEVEDNVYILEQDGNMFANGNFSWYGYEPEIEDSINIDGFITDRLDIFGDNYLSIEVIRFTKYEPTIIDKDQTNYVNSETILYQNYPNPFNPATTFEYSLYKATDVKLLVYDLNGNLLETIVNENQNSGVYQVSWNAKDFPSGVYICRLITDNFIKVNKLVLLK